MKKIYISTFNLQIQGQEKEQRRDLKGGDVDPTLAGKGALLDLRSLSESGIHLISVFFKVLLAG